MEKSLKGKRVFVTGACGTIGRELVRQLLTDHDVEELIGIDNNESELFFWSSIYRSLVAPGFSLQMFATVKNSAG